MPIRIKCPNCQKGLAVKDHLAGKKVSCPVCKNQLQIPVPVSAPLDVEAVAAQAFQDQPASPAEVAGAADNPAAAAPIKNIDLTCPYCDTELHFPAELGGKQAPCPECRNILRVPKLADDKPKDWRAMHKGPAAALAQQPQLDGAWGSVTNKGRVSTQALLDADAIPFEEESIGIGGWLKRGFWVAVVAGLAILVVTSTYNKKVEKRQQDAKEQALALVSKLPPAWQAEIQRGAGEFHLLRQQPNEALTHFRMARAKLAGLSGLDADAVLIELALNLVDLGGSEEEVQAKPPRKLDWLVVEREMQRTLEAMRAPEARALALRQVGSRLLGRQKSNLAIGLAVKMRESSDKTGGLATAQEIALLLACDETGQTAKLAKQPDPRRGPILDATGRLGYAEGLARKGQLKEATELACAKGPPLQRLQAAVGVAHLALSDPDRKEAAEVQAAINGCFLALAELKNQAAPWLLLQMVKTGAQTDAADKVKKLVGSRDKEFKGRAQLELFFLDLARQNGLAELALAEQVVKDCLARAQAYQALARHNTRLGYADKMYEALSDLDEKYHPFLYMGIALGELDARR